MLFRPGSCILLVFIPRQGRKIKGTLKSQGEDLKI